MLAKYAKTAAILDSHAPSRQMLHDVLAELGIEVVISTDSGQTGYQSLGVSQNPCDLVILGCHLSDMTARDFLEHLRSNPRLLDTHVIITGFDLDEFLRLIEFGISGILPKPFTAEVCYQVLEGITRDLNDLGGCRRKVGKLVGARLHENRGEHSQAISYYAQVLKEVSSPQLLLKMGQLYQRLGDQAHAQAHFDKAMSLDPKLRAQILHCQKTEASVQSLRTSKRISAEALESFSVTQHHESDRCFGSEMLNSALILSPSQDTHGILKIMLRNLSVQSIHSATSEREVAAIAAERPLDMVIVDLRIVSPRESSIALVKRLRGSSSLEKSKILVIDLDHDKDRVFPLFQSGIDGILVETLSAKQLRSTIEAMQVMDALTIQSGDARRYALTAKAFLETGDCHRALDMARAGLDANSQDGVCPLLIAICEHLTHGREAARGFYERAQANASELAGLCQRMFVLIEDYHLTRTDPFHEMDASTFKLAG